MNIQLRMIVLIGLLATGSLVIGMADIKKIQAQRFKQQEISRIEQQAAAIEQDIAQKRQQIAAVAAQIKAIVDTQDYKTLDPQLVDAESKENKALRELQLAQKMQQENSHAIQVMSNRPLSPEEKPLLDNYKANAQSSADNAIRKEQEYNYLVGLIQDLGKKKEAFAKRLGSFETVKAQREAELAEKRTALATMQKDLADLKRDLDPALVRQLDAQKEKAAKAQQELEQQQRLQRDQEAQQERDLQALRAEQKERERLAKLDQERQERERKIAEEMARLAQIPKAPVANVAPDQLELARQREQAEQARKARLVATKERLEREREDRIFREQKEGRQQELAELAQKGLVQDKKWLFKHGQATKVKAQKPQLGQDELKEAVKPLPDISQLVPQQDVEKKQLKSLSRAHKAILSGVVAVVVAGAFYAGLRWYQKKQISKVVAQYGRKQDDFSARQRDMMAAAVLASLGVPGTMSYLQSLISKYDIDSEGVDAALMWRILAQLYWRKSVDDTMVEVFKKRVNG